MTAFTQGEFPAVLVVPAQNFEDGGSGAVSAPDPHDLGRCAQEEATLMEVRIFGDDDQVVFAGVLPDFTVRGGTQPDPMDMDTAGIQIR